MVIRRTIFFMSDKGAIELLTPPPLKQKMAPPSAADRKVVNDPLRGRKGELFDGRTGVSFIVKGPEMMAHRYQHSPLTGYAVLPAVSDWAGNAKTLPDYLDGGSFVSLLHDPFNGNVKAKETDLFFHRYEKGYEDSSIVEGNYKLIGFCNTNTLEVYDLRKDPGELGDLSARLSKLPKERNRRLMQFLKREKAKVLDKTLTKNKKDKNNGDHD